MERTPNKSQHTKLTQEKKILPPLLPGFELATFRSRVRRSYQQAIPFSNDNSTIAIVIIIVVAIEGFSVIKALIIIIISSSIKKEGVVHVRRSAGRGMVYRLDAGSV